ncbi:hypothetical protein ACMSI6_08530 [Pseudomonas antarctica]|uniref:hypothetical protein n=1 Tax=Pseudomonas antarctica TaxID=219572 RepID=UPI0039C07346
MNNINNFGGLRGPFHGAAHAENAAVNAEQNPLSLSQNPSAQAGVHPTLVGQGVDDSVASVLSGIRNTDDDGSRKKRSADQPDTIGARAVADARLAKDYARVSALYVLQTLRYPLDVPVAAQSTLGRWRTQLDNAFKSAGFLEWAKDQGLDTAELKLKPSTGELTGTVGDKRHTFSLLDTSGWSDVSRTLLSIAKTIAPEPDQTLDYPWPVGKVPIFEVSRFYNQPAFVTPRQAIVQLKKLKERARFTFEQMPYASRRSPEALQQQQVALGDDANTHALIKALALQVDDTTGRIDLSKVIVPIDPHSTYCRDSDEPLAEVSVVDLLEAYELHVPKNVKAARNLASALSFDLAHRAPEEDRGCAPFLIRSTDAAVLGAETQAQVREIAAQWKSLSKPATPTAQAKQGADSLMGRLACKLPNSLRQAIKDDPAAALDKLIRLPDAKALGRKIQEALKGVETPTSAIEYLCVALALDLDSAVGASRQNLMGYNVYGQENIGASPVEIMKRFIRYLEGTVGVEIAPMAAHLLLSVSAPELLAKDLPPNLVYGSHPWASYSIEALRIEKQVPGAVANMTYSQVMLYGQTQPISTQEFDQLKEVRRGPVTDWAVANEVISARADNVYSAADYNLSVKALLKQQKELGWASKVLTESPPTRKEMALSALRRVFPGEGIDFEQKVIEDTGERWPFNVGYSLADIYMSGELYTKVWQSNDEQAVPYNKMRARFHELTPDINSAFDAAFSKYQARKEAAFNTLFRYHTSLMPVTDRERLKNSTISFYAVRKTYDGENYIKQQNHERAVPYGEPSPQEVESLTGRQGVLIQADRGNGLFDYYSYFPAQAKIVKEPGLSHALVSRPQKPWAGPLRNDRGDVLRIDDNPYHGAPPKEHVRSRVLVERLALPNTNRSGAHEPSDSAEGLKGGYFSKRSRELGAIVTGHFLPGFAQERTAAKGVTDREQERITNKKLNDFFLSLAPFHDGIKAALNGDVSGAALELGFDIFGFLIPGAGHARKALNAGRGVLKSLACGVVKGVAASFAFDDFLKAPNNIRTGIKAVGREVGHVASAFPKVLALTVKHFDPQKVYKHNDVVRNFHQKVTGGGGEMKRVTAIFLHGGWYAYNLITKAPYGVQLVQYGLVEAATA